VRLSNFVLVVHVCLHVTVLRDLGVIVNESLTPSNHIAKSFTSRDVAILVKAFVTYVRPLLEYNTVVWSPHLKGDIHTIEKVQRRFTKRFNQSINQSIMIFSVAQIVNYY